MEGQVANHKHNLIASGDEQVVNHDHNSLPPGMERLGTKSTMKVMAIKVGDQEYYEGYGNGKLCVDKVISNLPDMAKVNIM